MAPRIRMRADDRRAQLIATATAIISERGYRGLSLQDVADACGITLPGVLHHVGSKDKLLIAVLEHRDRLDIEDLERRLGEAKTQGAGAAERGSDPRRPAGGARAGNAPGLRRVCEAIVARNCEQREIVRLYAVLETESLAPDHPAHEYFADRQRRALEQFATLAAGRQEAGGPADSTAPDPAEAPETPTAEHRALAHRVLALMDGLQIQWLRDPDIDLVAAWQCVTAGMWD